MSKPIKPMDDFWKQMLDELDNTTNEERLQQTLYQFLKEHKLDKRIWTVFDSVEYKPEDFGIDLSDF